MEIHTEILPLNRPSAITIGFFDGVHLGHQSVIKKVLERAQEQSLKSLIVTFKNHPVTVLQNKEIPLICSLDHRLKLFEELGIDCVILLEFTKAFSEMTAEEFLEVLTQTLKLKSLILGYDAVLGKGREGQKERIFEIGEKLKFEVEYVPKVGHQISSSEIRRAIEQGNLEHVKELLGRNFSYYGKFHEGVMDLTPLAKLPQGEYEVCVSQEKRGAKIKDLEIEVEESGSGFIEVEILRRTL